MIIKNMEYYKFRETSIDEYNVYQIILFEKNVLHIKYYWYRFVMRNKIYWSSFSEDSEYINNKSNISDSLQDHSIYSDIGMKLEREYKNFLRKQKILKIYDY